MKYGVSVKGWQEWKPKKRKEMIMKFLRSKYPEIENRRDLNFNYSDVGMIYGPSEDEREVRMYRIVERKEKEWKVVDLKNIEWCVNVEKILREE